jgi:transcriptional regulator with XRE-family HTH domain
MHELRALLQGRLRQRGAKAQLAKETGIDASLIGKWADEESGICPSPKNLERLAPALGVSYEDLMRMCRYLPDDRTAPQSDPRVLSLMAQIETAWHRMDEAAREVAERGARALFVVPPTRATGQRLERATDYPRRDSGLGDLGENGGGPALSIYKPLPDMQLAS